MRLDIYHNRLLCRRIFRPPCGRLCCLEHFHSAGGALFSEGTKQLAEKNMRCMDIWNLRKECYRNLSGGQQQRVLLARALCASSKLLVLDEPVTGLDPRVTVDFYQLIQALNQEGLTIIMVSHDIYAAVKYASHILHVEKEKSFIGTTQEYRKSDFWKELGGENT